VAAAAGLALLLLGGIAPAQAGGTVQASGGQVAAHTVARAQTISPAARRHRHRVGVFVDINLRAQRATYFRNGRKVAAFHISSGKRGWRTPTGTYRIHRKLNGWHRSRLGLMWRPAYFRGGYAIHGSRSVPNYPASHGCVRVAMARMAWLAPNLPIGSTVRLHY
jgi:lipoprotein-anchoring transpeptidase ErfK/SrfK